MPIHEYRCPNGHTTEKMFLSFKEAAKRKHDAIQCTELLPQHLFLHGRTLCGKTAELVEFSTPRPAMLLGNPEGYHRPSPTKRFSTKLVSERDGNKNSCG